MILKKVPEDFKVKEIINLEKCEGKYSYYLLRKKGMNTMDAVMEVARKMGVEAKKIGYAGLKDKNAVTEQYISVIHGKEKSFKAKYLDVEYLGKGKVAIDSTILVGNEFEIVVRGLDEVLETPIDKFPNYFDEQRFGVDMKNHLVGKALLKKEFLEACNLMGLEATKESSVSVLQKNKRLVKLCFSAYQSYLFNLALAEYIKKNAKHIEKRYSFGNLIFPLEDVPNIRLPLLQFDTEEDIYDGIMADEGIEKRDFVVRQLPFLISTTFYRDAIASVGNFTIVSTEDDDKGKKKQLLKFTLLKGSYATMLLKFCEATKFIKEP
ncbi:MAG: tRNA pseudouridine(13) synthase TruD [Candidatus Woesearchaeota archaeon]